MPLRGHPTILYFIQDTIMKKILLALLITISSGCSTHHSFMDKAYVGYVENHAVVLFDAGERNGAHYYRPQFQSDCYYSKIYFDEQSSTGCVINAARISDLHPYNEHIQRKPTKRTEINHTFIEDSNSTVHISDNL